MTSDRFNSDSGENFEVPGNQLTNAIKKLWKDTTVRSIVVRHPDGRPLMTVPLAAGVAGGAIGLIMAPVLTVLAGIGAGLAKVRIEVVRNDDKPKQY